MSVFTPAYRATVYAPRSEQPSSTAETTILTPIATGSHSAAFQVHTLPSTGTWYGYMQPPRGRRSMLKPLEGVPDVGSIEIELLDKRLGTSNSDRWVSQFFSTDTGRTRLLGCLVIVEESLNNCDWHDYFTGRIQRCEKNDLLVWTLSIRDLSDDLKRSIFVGRPHASATYAQLTPLLPHHNLQLYHNIPGHDLIPATISTTATSAPLVIACTGSAPYDRWRILTRDLRNRVTEINEPTGLLRFLFTNFYFRSGVVRVYIRNAASPSIDGEFWLRRIVCYNDKYHYIAWFLHLDPVATTDVDYSLMSTIGGIGTNVEFYVYPTDKMGGQSSILIDVVHPVQLLADMCDGYFSPIDRTTGDPQLVIRRDASASIWTTLLADNTFYQVSAIVDKEMPFNEFAKALCQSTGLAIVLDGGGNVVPVDVRPGTAVATLPTITDTDLDADGVARTWELDAADAVTSIDVKFYADVQLDDFVPSRDQTNFPTLPPGLLETTEQQIRVGPPIADVVDLGYRAVTLDAKVLRYSPNQLAVYANAQSRATQQETQCVELATRRLAAYSRGRRGFTLACRRTSVPQDTQLGDQRLINVSTLFNPMTQLYGGELIARCIGREEQGPVVSLDFLYESAGTASTSTAVAPTISSPTLGVVLNIGAYVNAAVTLNASLEYAQVQYAVTTTAVTAAPGATATEWKFGVMMLSSGTAVVGPFGLGARVWVRANTPNVLAGGSTNKQSSPWAYPASTGYVDIASVTATISGITASSITGSTALIEWSGGVDNETINLLLHTGTSTTFSLSDVRITRMHPPRSELLTGLSLSTAYVVGVQQIDPQGGTSTPVFTTFTTSGSTTTLQRPAGIQIEPHTSIRGRVFLTDATHQVEVERHPDDGSVFGVIGTPLETFFVDPGSGGYFFDSLPPDGTIFWFRARTYANSSGEVSSGWTPFVWGAASPPLGTGPVLP